MWSVLIDHRTKSAHKQKLETMHHGAHHSIRRHKTKTLLAVLALFSALLCPSCKRADSSGDSAPEQVSATDVLQRMVDAYAEAQTYRDRGVVRLRYRVAGRWAEDSGRLSVKFECPNRLALHAYQLKMFSDGQRLRAKIDDSGNPELDQQVLCVPVSARLHLDDIYRDPTVLNVVSSGLGGPPVTLELLIGDDPIKEALAPDAARQLLEAGEIGDHPCHRVCVDTAEGRLIFWVDQHSYLLRRLEYPTERLEAQMRQSADCRDVSLIADFQEASFQASLSDEDFELDAASTTLEVTRFVVPPEPLPTKLLGKRTSDFYFTDLQGARVTRDSLSQAPAVLVWFNDHPASRACLEQLDAVQQAMGENTKVQFLAVCTEPMSLSNGQVENITQRWNVTVPTVRDLEAFGRDVFNIPWAPTLVVLDEKGRVQCFEVGANPMLQQQLPLLLRRLLAGEDIAAQTLAEHESQQRAYRAALMEARRSEIREARAPR